MTDLRTDFPTGGWSSADAIATNTRVNEHDATLATLGAGTVATIAPGNNIDVDSTDPANPIVSVEVLSSADISDFAGAADARVPAALHAATVKSTLAASDEFLLADSAASFGAKKIGPTALSAALAALMNQAQVKSALVASSAATLTLTTANDTFIHTGTGATWTLPAVTGNSGSNLTLQHLGTGTLTVQRAGTDNINKAGTTVTSFTMIGGSSVKLFNDGSKWNVLAIPAGLLNINGTPDGTKFLRDDGTWATVTGGGSTAASFKTIADYTGFTNTAGGNWTAAMIAMAKDTHGNAVGNGGDVASVVLPFGKGVFDGWDATVLGYTNISIIAPGGPWATMLTLNAPLVNTSGVTLGKLEVHGIGCYAGTATEAIKIGAATDNGGRFRCITDCEFWGFTGRGIAITGGDTPYFDIRRCTFALGVGGTGIYAAGYTDSWVIDHNEFRAYKVGIHIDGLISRFMVSNNNFMHVSDSNTGARHDVFFTASTSTTTERGQGALLFNNWHGPEGRSLSGVTGDMFYVIADRTGTTPNFLPNLAANSTNTIHGLIIRNATTFDQGTTPLVYSTVPGGNLKYCSFGKGSTRYGATGAPTLQIRDSSAPHSSNVVAPILDEFTAPATPAALAPAYWDGNKTLSAVNIFQGFTTTATAAGTTTLTVANNAIQEFTGTTTQTVKLPTTGVPAGAQYLVPNQSTGIVTVQSSGANTIATLNPGDFGLFTARVATPTTAANWLALTPISATGATLVNPTIKNYTETLQANGTVTTAVTINLTNGTAQTLTGTASTALTVTMPTAAAGKSFTLLAKQPAATGNATMSFTPAVKWPGNAAPTWTAGAGKADLLSFWSDGTNWYGTSQQNFTY